MLLFFASDNWEKYHGRPRNCYFRPEKVLWELRSIKDFPTPALIRFTQSLQQGGTLPVSVNKIRRLNVIEDGNNLSISKIESRGRRSPPSNRRRAGRGNAGDGSLFPLRVDFWRKGDKMDKRLNCRDLYYSNRIRCFFEKKFICTQNVPKMKKETNNISRVLKKKNLRSLEPLRLSLGAD